MSETELAIASVPIQHWGEIYDDKEALDAGTVFKDLYKPFFAASVVRDQHEEKVRKKEEDKKTDEQKKREDMMRKIGQVSFALDDLTLYLDTHGDEEEAVTLYHEKLNEREALLRQFAYDYYPLMRCQIADCNSTDQRFSWQTGPMPWEGACV